MSAWSGSMVAPEESCIEAATPSLARRRRIAHLGAKPPKCTVDSSCGNEKCIAPAHILVRPWKALIQDSKWRDIAKQISTLAVDDCIELPDYPSDQASMSRLRGGISSCDPYLKFVTRATAIDKGVKIFKSGIWGSAYVGRDGFESDTFHNILITRRVWQKVFHPYLEKGAFILGMLWGTSGLEGTSCVPKCRARACAFPSVDNGLCRQHIRFFDKYAASYGGEIDWSDMWPTEDNSEPLFHTGMLWEDQFNWLNVRFLHGGQYQTRNERASRKWWEDNVTNIKRRTAGLRVFENAPPFQKEDPQISEEAPGWLARQSSRSEAPRKIHPRNYQAC